MRRSLLVLVSLCLLAACDTETSSLNTLKTTAPVADPYQAALAQGYKQFAQEEYDAAEWNTSQYLANKGLMAAQGKPVAPEDPAGWKIAPDALPDLLAGRGELLEAITANASTQPQLTAQAVIAYDHWVIAAHTQTDTGRTEQRHVAFTTALAKLQQVHTVEPGIYAPSSEPLAPVFSKDGHGPTILYFPFDSAVLAPSAQAAISKIASDLQALPKVGISLNGHTDRAGSDAYNMNLSERRAKFVLHALELAGVPVKRMHYFAFGESDPAVPTADGVREPRNRRVEILLDH